MEKINHLDLSSLQSMCFFFKCNPEVHGGGVGKGEGKGEKGKNTCQQSLRIC